MSWVQAAGDKTVVMPNISYKLLHKLALQSDGPSSFLMAVLTGIIESTAIDGRARHGVLAQQNLITSIASHSYAKILFPLCHFMVAGARYHVPLYQWFRMPQPMTASSIAACFCEADSPITSSKSINEKDPMVIKVTNGNYVFNVNLIHVAKHSALLDLVMEIIGYDALENVYGKLGASQSRHEITTISNNLARDIYSFLKEHLPTASSEKKVRMMRDFLEKRTGRMTQISLDEIDDRLIADFWIEYSLDSQSKFRLFTNCAQSWVTYRQAIRLAARNRFQHANSLDALDEKGRAEINWADQDAAQAMYDEMVETVEPSDQLRQLNPTHLQTVKLLNTTEFDYINRIALFGDDGQALILTILRLATFGPLQARLVEASRKKTVRDDLMADLDDDDFYDAAIARIKNSMDTVQGLTEAAAFSLYASRTPAFIYAALPLADMEEQKALRDLATRFKAGLGKPIDTSQLAETISTALLDRAPQLMPALFERMQNARKKFRRKGLGKPPEAELDLWVTELANGIESLRGLLPLLGRLVDENAALTRLRAGQTSLRDCFSEDRDMFRTQFNQIYGVTS
jgi:hypothetical protein